MIRKLSPLLLCISISRVSQGFYFSPLTPIAALSSMNQRGGKQCSDEFCSSSTTSLEMARNYAVSDILKSPQWPPTWPYTPNDFRRQDETDDEDFYSQPRLVYHIDEGAVKALTQYYSKVFFPDARVLDICSSWVSHFPKDIPLRATALGMNQYELSKNTQVQERVVQNLNKNPVLPFQDNTFDFVTCVVSTDYLTRPLEVFSEIGRVLKPGGMAIMSQSNRCFPTKAINIWLQTNDAQHIFIIGSYFHYSGKFDPPESIDISPRPGWSDPMFIIQGKKKV